MPPRLIDWSRRLLAATAKLLPGSCALCDATCADALCEQCCDRFFAPRSRSCAQCAITLAADDNARLCGACSKAPPHFDATTAAADYAAPVDQLVLSLKFGARLALAPAMARMIHAAWKTEDISRHMPELMVAVPMAQQRLAERGFNQALEVAKPLARRLNVRLLPRALERVRETPPQSRLEYRQRRSNVRQAFVVSPQAAEQVRGRHVLLVDDVMTTGATLDEVAAVLKRHGAARVTNLVFARTPRL